MRGCVGIDRDIAGVHVYRATIRAMGGVCDTKPALAMSTWSWEAVAWLIGQLPKKECPRR
jgi:hypothetical protein